MQELFFQTQMNLQGQLYHARVNREKAETLTRCLRSELEAKEGLIKTLGMLLSSKEDELRALEETSVRRVQDVINSGRELAEKSLQQIRTHMAELNEKSQADAERSHESTSWMLRNYLEQVEKHAEQTIAQSAELQKYAELFENFEKTKVQLHEAMTQLAHLNPQERKYQQSQQQWPSPGERGVDECWHLSTKPIWSETSVSQTRSGDGTINGNDYSDNNNFANTMCVSGTTCDGKITPTLDGRMHTDETFRFDTVESSAVPRSGLSQHNLTNQLGSVNNVGVQTLSGGHQSQTLSHANITTSVGMQTSMHGVSQSTNTCPTFAPSRVCSDLNRDAMGQTVNSISHAITDRMQTTPTYPYGLNNHFLALGRFPEPYRGPTQTSTAPARDTSSFPSQVTLSTSSRTEGHRWPSMDSTNSQTSIPSLFYNSRVPEGTTFEEEQLLQQRRRRQQHQLSLHDSETSSFEIASHSHQES